MVSDMKYGVFLGRLLATCQYLLAAYTGSICVHSSMLYRKDAGERTGVQKRQSCVTLRPNGEPCNTKPGHRLTV